MKDELCRMGYLRVPAETSRYFSDVFVVLIEGGVRVEQSYRIPEEPDMDRDLEIVYQLPTGVAGFDRQVRRAIKKAQELSTHGFRLGLGVTSRMSMGELPITDRS